MIFLVIGHSDEVNLPENVINNIPFVNTWAWSAWYQMIYLD